ncbi:MAG: hypothetical protein M3303_12000 [Gemmatimonadota bacterium]|nr:hypothetical protein [Gemmatimonadota bacterium]
MGARDTPHVGPMRPDFGSGRQWCDVDRADRAFSGGLDASARVRAALKG